MAAAAAAAAAAALLHPHLFPVSFRSSSTSCNRSNYPKWRLRIFIQCSDSSPPNRGFGPKSGRTDNKKNKMTPKQSSTLPNQAPGISSPPTGAERNYTSSDDLQFEQRLEAVRRLALEQKKMEEEIEYGTIDYDASTTTKSGTVGLGTKIGVGVAVVAFGLVFALGDFLPSGSVNPTEEAATVDNKISEEERASLEKRLKQFEEKLGISPEDSTALEGAAVTLAEMRDYKRAATLLEKLTEKKPRDPDAFRLLGEVKYELKDYEGSVSAYRSAQRSTKYADLEILRGLTNSLLAARKPDQAVQALLASRDHLNNENSSSNNDGNVSNTVQKGFDVDPVQVDLLLGKAYSEWGHISDAISVYDRLISTHPDDFRGYLAKGIILKENGSIGDAERMFIQARFFAPDKAKVLVDKYSR